MDCCLLYFKRKNGWISTFFAVPDWKIHLPPLVVTTHQEKLTPKYIRICWIEARRVSDSSEGLNMYLTPWGGKLWVNEVRATFVGLQSFKRLEPPCPALQVPSAMSDSKTLCCCCCASGPIEGKVNADKTGYVPGEFVRANGSIENLR